MKYILLTLICLCSISTYAVRDIEVPLEMDSFQVEYRDISKTGTIRVKNCHRCKQDIYEFNETIKIIRNNQSITINELLKDYWNAKHPTVFLNLNDAAVVRISY